MTDMMAIKEKELYRRLNIALEQNNRKEARRYYGEALAWEKQMKYKYHK